MPHIQDRLPGCPLLEATQIDEDPRDAVVCDRLVIENIQRPDDAKFQRIDRLILQLSFTNLVQKEANSCTTTIQISP